MRFLASRAVSRICRSEILIAYGACCWRCGDALLNEFEIHHIIPWSACRITFLDFLVPVCLDCNDALGDSILFNWNLIPTGSIRQPIEDSVKVIESRLLQGLDKTSVNIAPRVGKSDIPRVLAMRSTALDCDWVLALSPWYTLAKQLLNEDKVKGFLARTRHATFPPFCFQDAIPKKFLRSNRERLVSATYGWARSREDSIVQAIMNAEGTPIIVGDEGHLLKPGNDTFRMVERFIEAGAHFVNMTGTAFTDLLGFSRLDESVTAVGYKVCSNIRETDEGEKIADLIAYEGMQSVFKIRGDVNFYMKDAWDAGYIATVDVCWIDLFGELDGKERTSSSFSKEEVRKRRGAMLRHPRTIRGAVDGFLGRFKTRKALDVRCKGLFYSMDDRGTTRANDHAESIKEEIELQCPRFTVSICTMNNDLSGSFDEKSEHLIEAFTLGVPGEKFKGQGWYSRSRPVVVPDILIVKTMGGVGLDAPELKTVCDLSNIRTLESCGQRWNRGGTSYGEMNTFDLILVDEPDVRDLYQVLVIDAGGDTECRTRMASEVSRDVIPISEDPIDPFGIRGAVVSELSDSRGQSEKESGKITLVQKIFELAPELQYTNLTRAELSKRMAGFDITSVGPANEVTVSTDTSIERLSNECESLKGKIARAMGIGYDEWAQAMTDIQAKAMSRAGIAWEPIRNKDGKPKMKNGKEQFYGMNKEYRKSVAEWERFRDTLLQMEHEVEAA